MQAKDGPAGGDSHMHLPPLVSSTQKTMKQRWYEDTAQAWSLPGSFTFQNQGGWRVGGPW